MASDAVIKESFPHCSAILKMVKNDGGRAPVFNPNEIREKAHKGISCEMARCVGLCQETSVNKESGGITA